jgi:hypothetical protein
MFSPCLCAEGAQRDDGEESDQGDDSPEDDERPRRPLDPTACERTSVTVPLARRAVRSKRRVARSVSTPIAANSSPATTKPTGISSKPGLIGASLRGGARA